LGSWRQPSAANWDGFARLSHSGSGVIAVFRNQSGVTEAKLALPLMPAGSYRLHSVMSNKDLGTFSKADWARGVPIAFAAGQTVEILEVRPTDGTPK
jgi:hypothetical protein